VDGLTTQLEDLYAVSSQRAVTGTLSSHPDCRDLHIDSLSVTFHGTELLVDTQLELNNGRRYGLIGLNGCGECHVSVTRSSCDSFSSIVVKNYVNRCGVQCIDDSCEEVVMRRLERVERKSGD